MESERYKEYHFFWGIFSKLCKFLSFTYLSEPHIAYNMHRHLNDLPCHGSLSSCQKDGIFYYISGARFTDIKNIRSKSNITDKPNITNITYITKLGHSQYPAFTHLSVPRTCLNIMTHLSGADQFCAPFMA